MDIGQLVRWSQSYDDYPPFYLTFWFGRLKLARGEIVRVHHDGRLEVFWRWRNGESSISLHSTRSLEAVNLLDVLAEESEI